MNYNNSVIPFDLKYAPDLVFTTSERCAEEFPIDAGIGTLYLRPIAFCNFANLILVVDNYFVQFSGRGMMYILDIPKGEVMQISFYDNHVLLNDKRWQEWVALTALVSEKMMNVFERNPEACKYMKAFASVMFFNTMSNISPIAYRSNLAGIKRAFGVSEDSTRLEIRNRTWYYDGQAQTWGAVGHSLLRDFFKGVLN